MGLIFKEADHKPVDPKTARLRATLLSLPLALIGLLALVGLVHDGLLGGLKRQQAMGLLSAAIVCGGLIALIFGVSAKKQAILAAELAIPDEKPWLNRKDWAGGRILNSSRRAVVILWIFVGFWCLASAVIFLAVVLTQWRSDNHLALLVLLFPVVGLGILLFALKTTLAWRTFNRCVFQMAALPAAAGGTLTGEIRVQTRLRPQYGLYLRLSCVRRAITGKSNNRQTAEKILWQDEKWLRPDFASTDGATSIPVFFNLPGNFPDSSVSTGDGIHWKLEASAKLRGPNFQAAFDVPVFRLPEMPAAAADPTAPYQMSLDDIREQIRSRIQVRDRADGVREFIFPPARNPGFATGASVVCLVWTVLIVVLLWKKAPLPFLLALTAMDLLMLLFVLDVWFRRSHVTVTPAGVTVERAWFTLKKQHHFPRKTIHEIASDVGATAGHAVYHDLKVQTRDGKDFVLAKHLNNQPETDWLVRQMTAALQPVTSDK